MDYLDTITDALLLELQQRYPKRNIELLKLQAPGWAIKCSEDVMVKTITTHILVDVTRKWEHCAEPMLCRKLEVEYANPQAVELVLAEVDKWLNTPPV